MLNAEFGGAPIEFHAVVACKLEIDLAAGACNAAPGTGAGGAVQFTGKFEIYVGRNGSVEDAVSGAVVAFYNTVVILDVNFDEFRWIEGLIGILLSVFGADVKPDTGEFSIKCRSRGRGVRRGRRGGGVCVGRRQFGDYRNRGFRGAGLEVFREGGKSWREAARVGCAEADKFLLRLVAFGEGCLELALKLRRVGCRCLAGTRRCGCLGKRAGERFVGGAFRAQPEDERERCYGAENPRGAYQVLTKVVFGGVFEDGWREVVAEEFVVSAALRRVDENGMNAIKFEELPFSR